VDVTADDRNQAKRSSALDVLDEHAGQYSTSVEIAS